METALNVKDFIIDIPKTIEEIKNKKTKVQSQTTYEVILENNTDFVIHRITSTTDKNLVFLVSQGLFYIKNNKNDEIETLTEQRIRSFFQSIYYSRFEDFKKVEWWKGTPENNVSTMISLIKDETMRKIYQHGIYAKKYECESWTEAFNENPKLLANYFSWGFTCG